MRTLHCSRLAPAVIALSLSASQAIALDLARLPLYAAYDAAATDALYTTDVATHQAALSRGYVNEGIVALVLRDSVHGTRPLRRFYKGAPQTDHYMTALPREEKLARARGFADRGTEGYVYRRRVPGTVPMVRLFKTGNQPLDIQHRLTTNPAELAALRRQGWSYERIVGYVYPPR